MKKTFITLATALPLGLAAQFFSSPNQQLIKDAVDGGIVIFEQSYQLEDTVSGQRFGRYGNKEFGKTYSLAVLTDSGYCLSPDALTPWHGDANFEKYRHSHKPVLYKTAVRHFGDSIFTDFNGNIATAETLQGGYGFVKTLSDEPTLIKDTADGLKNGWIVWIVGNDSLAKAPASIEISYQPVRREIEIVDTLASYAVDKPFTDKTLLGGIYIVPVRKSLGQISFKFVGIVESDGNDNWCVVTPLRRKDSDENISGCAEELTPLSASPLE